MKTLVLFLSLITFTAFSQTSVDTTYFTAKVVSISDGDSYRVLVGDSTKITIRLHGIDCAETKNIYVCEEQPGAIEGKTFVRNLIFGKTVLVKPLYRDNFDRLVADVVYQDEQLAITITKYGFGWVVKDRLMARESYNLLMAYKKLAVKNKIGIWSIPGTHISPALWKKRNSCFIK